MANELTITQGDSAIFNFTAKTGAGTGSLPIDLTGAVFESYMKLATGILTIPGSQHAADPDQVNNKGKFTMTLTTTNTASLRVSPSQEIVTKVVQGANTVYVHGAAILNVLSSSPQT